MVPTKAAAPEAAPAAAGPQPTSADFDNLLQVYEDSIDDLKQQVLQLQATRHMEAPASANFRVLSSTGIDILFTVRGDDEHALLKRLGEFIPALTKMGMTTGGKVAPSTSQSTVSSNAGLPADAECPIHHVPMKKFEKNGSSWFSHRLDDGSYCNGKPKRN